MKYKRLIAPNKKRTIPEHFSWVDHRLMRDGYISNCSIQALGLYLLLLTVSDADGLSYYGDKKIAQELNIPTDSILKLRKELIILSLIAYEEGIYQVLELSRKGKKEFKENDTPITGTHSMNEILQSMFGDAK